MDETGRFSISAQALYAQLGTASAPILLDVRQTPSFLVNRVSHEA